MKEKINNKIVKMIYQELMVAINNEDRAIKIDTILRYAGDEFENESDYIELAKMNNDSLNKDLKNLIDYYAQIEKS